MFMNVNPVKIFYVRRERSVRHLSSYPHIWACLPHLILRVGAGNQQGSFLCSFVFWISAGCRGLQNLIDQEVVLSWVAVALKG